ncbi:MAG: hypothetical protein ACK57C_01515 [Bacteroidota bacterium]
MKYLFQYLFLCLLLFACQSEPAAAPGADNALDAGRNYLQASLEGDFVAAARYCAQDSLLQRSLREDETAFRLLDREGRQLHRSASIQVHALEEVNNQTALLVYSLSYEPEKKDTLYMRQIDKRWFIISPQ